MMGTWGEGNFDKDDAYEFLDIIIDDLIRTVKTCMTSSRQANYHWFYERYAEARLMPAIDVLIRIVEYYKTTLESRLDPNEIDGWKNAYLKIYDEVINDYTSDSAYITGRRKVIADTFTKLKDLAEDDL